MNQPTYSLDTNAVTQVADDTLARSNKIHDLIIEMDGNLRQYLNQWLGTDAAEYEGYKNKWLNLVREMLDVITKASGGLHQMVGNIKNTENKVRGTFQV